MAGTHAGLTRYLGDGLIEVDHGGAKVPVKSFPLGLRGHQIASNEPFSGWAR
jgi:hypothetical protein